MGTGFFILINLGYKYGFFLKIFNSFIAITGLIHIYWFNLC
jgi:hypothetical protein